MGVITGVGDLFILAEKKMLHCISKNTHNTENMFNKLLHINFLKIFLIRNKL